MKKKQRKSLRIQHAPFEKLRVMAEYGSSGIWLIGQIGVFRHGMIGYSSLGLASELAERFERWISRYENTMTAPDEFDYQTFNEEGRQLAHALKRHVGCATYIEFQAETAEGGLEPSEEIL